MTRFFLILMLLQLMVPGIVTAAETRIRIVTAPGQELAIGELVVPIDQLDRYSDGESDVQGLHPGIRSLSANHFPFLYPVQHRTEEGKALRWLFRVPAGVLPGDSRGLAAIPFIVSDDRHHNNWSLYQSTGGVLLADPQEFSRLEAVWKPRFLKKLGRQIEGFEDHELELLLHLRWGGGVVQPRRWSWKRDEITRFLFSISGVNDIRDALPDKPGVSLTQSKKLVQPPDPILLPPVESPEVPLPVDVSPLADRIPRSCWYGEWESWEGFRAALDYAAGQFDQWSPGSWPRSGREMIGDQLRALGLSEAEEARLHGKIDAVALAGWDFSFQSGTSLLLVIRYRPDCEDGKPYPDRIRVFCSSDKLLRMAESTRQKGRSLRQDPAFRAARMKLALDSAEVELGYVFLSDPWLTNLLSPRWRILGDRLNRLDSRIRLARLLSCVQAAEEGKDAPVSLAEMKKKPLLPGEWQSWLLQDLVEKDGRLVHQTLGGLYQHPAVDAIPFAQVTETEAREYEEFRRRYTNRWRRMDPIALQVIRSGKDGLFRSRLYVSPISNRSEIGQIRRFVPRPKVVHQLEAADGLALGISLAIASDGFGGMMPIPIPLPVNLFLRFYAWDFAPTSFRSSTWRLAEWPQDDISWARAPFIVGIPSLLTAMLPGFGIQRLVSSDYPGLEIISGIPPLMATYSLFSLGVEGSGFRYVSLDPGSLLRLKDRFRGTFTPDPRPCDLRVFLDLSHGYMLRRKIWQLAVQNRSLAGWRRLNRMKRMHQLLGWRGKTLVADGSVDSFAEVEMENGKKSTPSLSLRERFQGLNKRDHLFPVDPIIGHNLPQSIPDRVDPRRTRHDWGPSVHRAFDELPGLLQQLLRMDLFVSVEEDALLFETDWQLALPAVTAAAPGTVEAAPAATPTAAPEEPAAPVLDFDAE